MGGGAASGGSPSDGGGLDPIVRRRLDGLIRRASAALAWERLWPALWWPLGVLLAFLAVSWLGLWGELPVVGRQIGLGLFAILFLAAFWPAVRLRSPGRAGALDRIDRDSGTGHRPARALEDSLALGGQDPGSRALWELHRRRAEADLSRLSVAAPKPGMARRDPFALRAAAITAAVAAAFVAGPELGSRLGAAFDWRGAPEPGSAFRIDGWIDPPLYTLLPPLMIDFASGQQRLRAPVGSTIVVRMAGQGEASVAAGPGLSEQKAGEAPKDGLRERRYKLTGSSELGIKTGLAARTGLPGGLSLAIEAIPDLAPEIVATAPPEVNARGTFNLTYKAKDDYGIASAEARIERAESAGGRRSLVAAPVVGLQLPPDHRSGEETKTVADLTEHPWAGARIRMTLVVRDEAGQEGTSAPVEFTLPQRPFTKPLAKALVEQRRNIILDPDHRRQVQTALDSLLIAPERFTPEWGIFLGLRFAADRYRAARTDADLTEVAEWLWAMALQIEEGDLSEAERELRAAQERLREAIDRGADEKEIARLTDDLRRAMDRFLREFAEQMRRDQQNAERQPPNGQERVITQNDLNRMIQEMQEAMKRGDVAEAQRLLDQLRNMLENLKTARPSGRMSDPMAREMNRQMEELDSIIREQQRLRDETFRQGQGERSQPGQRGRQQQGQRGQQGQGQEQGESGEGGQQGQGSLADRQRALRDRLAELQRRMRGMGMQGEQGFGDAEGAMRDAEGQIGQGRDGQAVDSQGRALEGLQRGMQGMAQQMQRMMGENSGDDQGGEPGGPGNPQGRASNDPNRDDPLGRPTRSRDYSDGRVRIPGADETAVARARRILEELRRKLGDPTRPQEELDYFERLLRRN
ncbi:TIGR02302 family protein [Enterovirga rhinocerotis]|uniref:Uncharacterized protein (TIGR02302 family) n=1 Tax=Enterovirga rhinocerotis TaxID=1339210 RepID=A0A4R7C077_9HYPH|nr:TIGR02302 family protein [Enterovirga rhinocerotis]TDR89776.1 uncharacterized protein (TIGR02302 family) [Enterovirga rhinocerotis]